MPNKNKSTSDDSTSKKSLTEELIDSLLDPAVITALGQALGDTISTKVAECLESKIAPLGDRLQAVESQCTARDLEIGNLRKENSELRVRLEDLEAYSKLDNLIVHGLLETSFSESASAQVPPTGGPVESNLDTVKTFVNFANTVLDIPLSSQDISVAHRMKKGRSTTSASSTPTPAPIIIRFTNREARNRVYRTTF